MITKKDSLFVDPHFFAMHLFDLAVWIFEWERGNTLFRMRQNHTIRVFCTKRFKSCRCHRACVFEASPATAQMLKG